MRTPSHIAIIMDGNRRWANAQNLPLVEGYRRGIEAFRNAIPAVIGRKIPVATFWGFSTENWRRGPKELNPLFNLFRRGFEDAIESLNRHNARLVTSGRLEDFPAFLRKAVEKVVAATRSNTALIANLALSYGGRDEIQRVAKAIAAETKGDPQALAAVNETTVNRHLYTAGLPDVDFLIRTGGEKRLSGFLPWQAAYAELYFTDTLWPDFDEQELHLALADYAGRKRNFGV